ncbi:PREDICTED: LOW QUALITY PROTEIN: leiomodin-1-like [Camelina sativa]|uniref:LOW QUALITY PROTEIN: leiomodin-1-like n=1 Tax=Camelina sativa TaxID=90675 RepID=A0ABM1R1G1_CAMSA|nr:PREDICTED: LOW QUALITY PROTEIN: leiomodin-1-like [Camelina sativa]
MAAMFKRPRPAGGRHPPPLAPTVSSFKPRAQWTNSGSSIFLYVNLPDFYIDQISIKKDERTRIVQIEGQRRLSAQTKARFNESYRVSDTCDMTKLSTSFSHGLLTIEFPAIVEGDKKEKAVQDQGKTEQSRSNQEKSGHNESTLVRKKPLNEEKQVGTIQEKAAPTLNEEKPKTYKSVVESKREVPTGSREKSEPKVKAGEAIPNVRGKESPKEEKVVERKEAAQMGQQKIIQKLKEEEAKRSPTLGTSTLKPKVRAIEEEVNGGKKDANISQNKTGQMVKEKEIIRKSPAVDASLGPKVQAKLVEKKGDGEIGQKLKEGENINAGQKELMKYTKPVVGDEARRTEKKTNQPEPELKPKEGDERTELDVDDGLIKKQDEKNEKVGDIPSEGKIQEIVEQKKIEETVSAKDTGDHKDNAEVVEQETGPLLVKEGQTKTSMDPPPTVGGRGMGEEENRTYTDISLVNVGAAALVIMGFGAYVFVPLVKYFS